MIKRIRFLVGSVCFFFLVAALWSQQLADPFTLIGMREEAAFALWEDPMEIAVSSGPTEREVYYPSRGVTLGIYQNRVWQVRFDETTPLSWRGIGPGVSQEKMREILGDPYYSCATWDLYLLPGGPWPLRLRVFYRTGEAFDFYLYRGDF